MIYSVELLERGGGAGGGRWSDRVSVVEYDDEKIIKQIEYNPSLYNTVDHSHIHPIANVVHLKEH